MGKLVPEIFTALRRTLPAKAVHSFQLQLCKGAQHPPRSQTASQADPAAALVSGGVGSDA